MSVKRISTADGVTLAVEERGAGDRALLLVHGFSGFRQDFARQVPHLEPFGRLVLPDLRGHGASTNTGDPADYTFDALVADLVGVLDALGIARCDLLGHSMGGMLALRLALAHPERLHSLVLMDTTAGPLHWVDPELLDAAARLGVDSGMEVLAQVLRARAKDDPDRGEPDRRVEAEWGEDAFWAWRTGRIVAMDPVAYGALGHEMVERPSLAPRLGEIACPTLVMVGARDDDFLAPSTELSEGIPGAHLAILPGAGHQPQHEAPEAWREALLAHLARVRA